jgi:NAD(P)-dependent dehydrogenase (short-subunit alcohol dehydrogenase family)
MTAASKGLGRGCAKALAAEGARVVLNARDGSALDAVAVPLPEAVAVPGDISDPALPVQLIDTANELLGSDRHRLWVTRVVRRLVERLMSMMSRSMRLSTPTRWHYR